MVRDLARLAAERFDVAVVGGGVYGLTIARALALRGRQVAIVERGDFGGATSWNSLKTVHGGIRALQHGSLAGMRQFVRERRRIAAIAPHLVRPLPFIIPTGSRPPRTPSVMRLFLAAYDLLSGDRNHGLDPARHLPPSRVVSRDECLALNPLIDPAGVTGGALWHDYQLHSPERFALALLRGALERGAAAANYAEVVGLIRRDGHAAGVTVRDRETGATFDLRANTIVNAAGPWAGAVLERLNVASGPRPGWSLALNLVLDEPAPALGLGGLANGRFLFMVPWRTQSIVGTSHAPWPAQGAVAVPRAAVDAFLGEARLAFPRARLTRAAVRLVHRGLLPAPPRPSSADALLKHSIIHDHAAGGVPGLLTVIGVRYTTAGATAAAVADTICGPRTPRPDAAHVPLPGGETDDIGAYERDRVAATSLDAALVRRLVATYGTRDAEVSRRIEQAPDAGHALGPGCPVTRAEILHAIESEMALHLTDVLLRRTLAGAGGHPGPETTAAAADIMAARLGWDAARVTAETEAVDRAYRADLADD